MGKGPIIAVGGMDKERVFWQSMENIFRKISIPQRLLVLLSIKEPDRIVFINEVMPKRYQDWRSVGVRQIRFLIANDKHAVNEDELQRLLQWTDMIAIMGGDTRAYYRHYCRDAVATAIRDANSNGKAVLGVSAGCLILSADCIIWGSENTINERTYLLQSEYLKDQWEDGDLTFRMGKGMGLFTKFLLDVHCTQYGRIPRLAQALKLSQTKIGIGLDADACILVMADSIMFTYGQGLITVIKMNEQHSDTARFKGEIELLHCRAGLTLRM